MNKRKWELLNQRVERTFNRAINKKGGLSLATIVESQYYYPRNYPLKPNNSQPSAGARYLNLKPTASLSALNAH